MKFQSHSTTLNLKADILPPRWTKT